MLAESETVDHLEGSLAALEGAIDPQADERLFGLNVISLGFPHRKTAVIRNTSLVPMDFELHITGAEHDENIIKLEPAAGNLPPESEKEIVLTVEANREKVFNLSLDVNVKDVGENLLRVPISFQSKVPKISQKFANLDLGDVFLKYPYNAVITLYNESNDLKAYYKPGFEIIRSYSLN